MKNILITMFKNHFLCQIVIFLLIIALSVSNSFSQTIIRWDDIPVTVNNIDLKNPWTGGLNNPQFSDIDLNGNGIKDLFIFDRSRNIFLTFINDGTPGQSNYEYKPEYESLFPELHHWALLVDYNGDGKNDIFTAININGEAGVRVYRNDFDTINGLSFTLVKSIVEADSSPPSDIIYSSEWDIPAITDIDGDGDIDLLTFELFGYNLYYYRNRSIEKYGTSDSLDYVLDHYCWGYFSEAFGSNVVTLNDTCLKEKKTSRSMHPGSTTLALDLNGDSAMEVLIGDINSTNLYMLTNGGTKNNAFMTNVDTKYPILNPVDIDNFPASFFVDVNNDGIKDLLAGPNSLFTENFSSSWYYSNIGTNSTPDFLYQTNSFLQDEMIEVGLSSFPVFFDYNGDSLLDLVIGNEGYYFDGANDSSGLSLYKNTGTLKSPEFELITRDFANIFSLISSNIKSISPTFGDLDNDGDQDMIFGESEGNLHYYENTAAKNEIASFSLKYPNYGSIDVGTYSTPQLIDVNRDGLLDLLIGEKDTNLCYYQNTGTTSSPVFTLITNHFGKVNVKRPQDSDGGYIVPFLTILDSTGEYTLLTGSNSGYIYRYTNIDGNLTGAFTLSDSFFIGFNFGTRSTISGGDLDGNGTIDLVIGNAGGGVVIFKNLGDSIPPPPIPPEVIPFNIRFLGNPVFNYLAIDITGAETADKAVVYIYNMYGQLIYGTQFNGKNNLSSIRINTDHLPSGVYYCKVFVSSIKDRSNNQLFRKFVKLN